MLRQLENPLEPIRHGGDEYEWVGPFLYRNDSPVTGQLEMGYTSAFQVEEIISSWSLSLKAAIWMGILPLDHRGGRFNCGSTPISTHYYDLYKPINKKGVEK